MSVICEGYTHDHLLEQAISTDDGDRAAKIIQDTLRHWENSKERARTRNSAVFVGGQLDIGAVYDCGTSFRDRRLSILHLLETNTALHLDQ